MASSRPARLTWAVALLALALAGACAPAASAAPLSMTFTEARANVGVQLSDAALFEAPDLAPLQAQIDPGSGAISGGVLQVPDFSTFITDPVSSDVTVEFAIGVISGSFNQASGALSLSGEAGGTLTAEGKECTVSTEPQILTLSTAGSSGGASPRAGAPFTAGLTGPGAIAGQWTDMHATPVGGDIAVCETVEERIEGPGGVWLDQKGDVVPPAAPQLTGTDPPSPGSSGTPRILGAAEPGSTVRIFAGPECKGTAVAGGSAAELAAPGIAVKVGKGATAAFSATATDAAGNTSACSAPISYRRLKALGCVVPKLKGESLRQASAALQAAHCTVGKVRRPKRHRGRLVVKASSPPAGKALAAGAEVDLKLGPKPRKAHG